jgi:hypothetical protein
VIGRWGLAILEQGVQSYPLSLFTKQLGMTPQEAKALGDGAFNVQMVHHREEASGVGNKRDSGILL